MKKFVLLVSGLLLVQFAAVGMASADSVTYNGAIVLTKTNWNSSITIPKFDATLGTLTSIQFSLAGHVEGSAKFESLDAAPATVTMDLSAMLKLQRPDLSTLVVTIPVVSTLDNVTAFDGVIDFGGTSGRTYPDLSADKTESAASSAPGDLVLFTATFLGENITLPVVATGASSGSGAGNLVLQFGTFASADASVTYFYDPIPEPSSLLALLAGVGGLAGAISFRRK